MLFDTPVASYSPPPLHVRALEAVIILLMDHEQNASSSTVRIAASSLANPYACVCAGIASLWGPAHGGANEEVINMLEGIGSVDHIPALLEEVKGKTRRLMGFGHRIYHTHDPRAAMLKTLIRELLENVTGRSTDPLLEIALRLEEAALADPYFISRRLFPNVSAAPRVAALVS